MSNIDKQWLQQKIAEMEAARDEIPFGLDEGDSNTLAALRIALASLEAEPYGYVHKAAYEQAGSCGLSNDREAYRDSSTHVAVYTAPPAPVSVPAAMEMDDDFDSAFEHGKAVGWNAYRAAMLQSFGNSEQLNSPVIPDGWVAVPVEPTIAILDEFDSIIDYGAEDSKDAWSRLLAAAWIKSLPAAPQQEVK
ncbi:hypothetical protein M5Y66_09790 [Enterobacter vonholyi]|uniref:hypothetical protein n=1 Tax=Enterobacter vonholyi TaxID=2797505 RepID=UPI0020BFFF7D|nr:hypothetical protein [Enterobacter vonholyi]MCL5634793.1 hypothetical protein [Enterobacter vonholyi]